ncbi:MAG: TetR/AcrR family transcriptional regulator [Rhodospirillales bacterium]|jgi:AcrR family transcriptional regulator|nr:TetR/AcrR family transcriptional regulator [Rhodospirillales bacterium]
MDKSVNTLTRENWIDFALQRLTEEGIDKVTITGLARELSVTKGSFYWHFKDRDDLLQAMLVRWEESGSKFVFGEVERVGGDAVRRLKHLSDIVIRRYGDQLNLELALRDWGRKDLKIANILRQEDEKRIDYISGLFVEIYGDVKVAEAKAWLLFSLFVGEIIIAAPMKEQSRENMLWTCLNSVFEDMPEET